MKGFLLGIVVASVGYVGGFYLYQARQEQAPIEQPAVAEAESGAPGKRRPKKPRRRAPSAAPEAADESGANAEPEQPERKLTATELKSASRGDDLSRPDVLELDLGSGSSAPELSEEQIDQTFRGRQTAILDCIDKARPDEQTYVPGRVTVQFRIQRTGQVRGVRVEAPAILQQGGLYPCVKAVVMGLRFPASSGSQVVTYPFSLS